MCYNACKNLPASVIAPNATNPYFAQFFPCVGLGSQIPQQPLKMFVDGNFNRNAAVMMGNARYEGNFLAYTVFDVPPNVTVSDEVYNLTVDAIFGDLAPNVLNWYSEIAKEDGNWIAMAYAFGDYAITCGTAYSSEAIASITGGVYRFQWSHAPQLWSLSFLNATHATDVPFVFMDPATPPVFEGFAGEEVELAYITASLWGSFATTGEPGKLLGITWEPFNGIYNIMDINIAALTNITVDDSRCQHWYYFLLG